MENESTEIQNDTQEHISILAYWGVSWHLTGADPAVGQGGLEPPLPPPEPWSPSVAPS